MKKCSTCKEVKELQHYSKHKSAKDGLSAACKECAKKAAKAFRERAKLNKTTVLSKKCSTCQEEKPASEYWANNTSADSLHNQCKVCVKQYRAENRDKLLEYSKFNNKRRAEAPKKQTDGRVCAQCKQYKTTDEFWKSKHTSDGLYSCCIDCKKKLESTEHRLKIRYKNRRDWFIKNKEYSLKKTYEWLKQRRKTDKAFLIKTNVNNAIMSAVRKYSFKNVQCEKIKKIAFRNLPYTPDELIAHIESQWEPWMNWDNYGRFDWTRKTWQIDHIIPQSKLTFTSCEDDNFKKLWALENLRPLETLQNIKKRDKIIGKICLK